MLVPQTLKDGKISRLNYVVILTSLLFGACSDELSKARPYVLTTATTGGTFYPLGSLLRLLRMRSWPRAMAFL